MGLFSKLFQNTQSNAIMRANIAQMKAGKSPEQCKIIDFFFAASEEQAKKRKGCVKALTTKMDFDAYLAHIQNMVDGLNLKERAIAKIGLDESQISEIPPVVLHAFQRNKDYGFDTWKKYEYDKHGAITRVVYNVYKVTWIFFSATQIYTYTYIFDTMSNDTLELTRDFFYSDITCIRTEHQVEEDIRAIRKGCFGKKYAHFDQHYDTLQITVPSDSYSFTCTTNDTIEQSIMAAKAMIREKKNA